MSNGVRYDSLLVRYLAAELEALLGDRVLRALRLDGASRTATLAFRRGVLIWDLHPSSGVVRWLEDERAPAPAGVAVIEPPRGARIARVSAPPDERLLHIDLSPPAAAETESSQSDGARADSLARIVVELLTNHWNVLALDARGRILGVLRPREAAGRELRPGASYAAPRAGGRAGAEEPIGLDEWRALLDGVPAAERERVLLARVAYTSPINSRAILGDAVDPAAGAEALDAAYARYHALVDFPAPAPHVLRQGEVAQPYPLPLPGVAGEPFPSLLAAIAAAASGVAAPERLPPVTSASLERLRDRIAALQRRITLLREEQQRSGPRAAELRRHADLLLAQLDRVAKGMTEVEISDFAGGTVRVALDPALAPAENARRLYEAARKRERAAAQLPARIRELEAEHARLQELLARAEAGEAREEEVRAAIGAGSATAGGAPRRLPPYRRYRTSGGLEVRVGRNREANDELTFHHSSPSDVWLHARGAAGSHVILRWPDPDANPPARDLTEAAVLAALHSRARTSGTVAVDWTRRKYVRKPRKAPPGLVAPERVRTLFVVPDPATERRLRVDEPGPE
ncbi:MAG TPA: NFACT RNA binding domain-containing protein [Longimicrobiales bacterium]